MASEISELQQQVKNLLAQNSTNTPSPITQTPPIYLKTIISSVTENVTAKVLAALQQQQTTHTTTESTAQLQQGDMSLNSSFEKE